MANVEIYIKPTCPFCIHALGVLRDKGVSPTVYDLFETPELRDKMIKRAGGASTVPQIFIDNTHIGGCDDLCALDAKGGLDPLL
jgi:glutaredoxin 3